VLLPQRPLGSSPVDDGGRHRLGSRCGDVVREPAPTQAILAPVSLPAAPMPAAPAGPTAPKKADVGPVSTAPRRRVCRSARVFAVLALVLAGGLGWLWMKKADRWRRRVHCRCQLTVAVGPTVGAGRSAGTSAIAEGNGSIAGYAAGGGGLARGRLGRDPTAQSLRGRTAGLRLAASPASCRTLHANPSRTARAHDRGEAGSSEPLSGRGAGATSPPSRRATASSRSTFLRDFTGRGDGLRRGDQVCREAFRSVGAVVCGGSRFRGSCGPGAA
jgi:hypothetical protein